MNDEGENGMPEGSGIRLGIGILAHNEAETLPVLVDSLFGQSIFHRHLPSYADIHVVCVPNGCTDATAEVVRAALKEHTNELASRRVTWSVAELPSPGKAVAWNHCVHRLLAGYDYICVVDADIMFAQDDTVHAVLSRLVDDPQACVASDMPLKRPSASTWSWLSRLSEFFSRVNPPGPTQICGQFYCARGSVLQSIWMPPGMPVEDGFLRAMVITNEFRQSEDPRRIVRESRVSHFFEPCQSVREIWHHKKRLVIGTALNSLLFRYLWQHAGANGAGQLLREQLERDPKWFSNLILKEVQGQRWVVPMGHIPRQIRDLRALPIRHAIRRAPFTLGSSVVEALIALSANRTIRRGFGLGYW